MSNLIPTKGGFKHILVIVDLFSKFIKAYPTKKCNTKTTIALLERYAETVGMPDKILADNATYFHNQRFIRYWENRQVKVIFTTVRHPKANIAERYIEEILRFLRIAAQNKHKDWVYYVKTVEDYLNNVPSTVTSISPITLMFGTHPNRPWINESSIDLDNVNQMVKNCIRKHSERILKREHDKIRKKVKFKETDLVIIKKLRYTNRKLGQCAKLMYNFEGPYIINKVLNANTYELKYLTGNKVRGKFHIELLYPYTPSLNNEIKS